MTIDGSNYIYHPPMSFNVQNIQGEKIIRFIQGRSTKCVQSPQKWPQALLACLEVFAGLQKPDRLCLRLKTSSNQHRSASS